MSNINLKKILSNNSNIISNVDSNIKLNKIESTENIVYNDIKLDLDVSEYKLPSLNASISTKDLKTITNEEAIITSLKNIMNTKKCSRLLNPELDFNLSTFLFEPLNESKAWFIGYMINKMIPEYEPRVTINSVSISINYDEDSYYVSMEIYIPEIEKELNFSTVLNSTNFQ